MNVGTKKGAMADINITPYIDILLVLLIIFMVITPVRQMDWWTLKCPRCPTMSQARKMRLIQTLLWSP